MNKTYFDAITANLDERITVCSTNFGAITADTDIQNLTIADARRLRNLAKEESEKMTTIAMCDLYHVIGMGNLSAVQLSEFMKRIKKYLSFRPVIKAFANTLSSIDELPTIKPDTMYKLQELGDFCLTSGEDGKEDISTLSEYRMKGKYEKVKLSKLEFTLDGATIKLPEEQIDNFIKYGSLIGISPNTSSVMLRYKISRGCKFCGIAWEGFDSDGNAVGKVNCALTLATMEKYIMAKRELER